MEITKEVIVEKAVRCYVSGRGGQEIVREMKEYTKSSLIECLYLLQASLVEAVDINDFESRFTEALETEKLRISKRVVQRKGC